MAAARTGYTTDVRDGYSTALQYSAGCGTFLYSTILLLYASAWWAVRWCDH